MRKLILLLPMMAMLLSTGCEEEPVAKKYNVTVSVTYPEGIKAEEVSELEVTAVNQKDSKETLATFENGVASFVLNAGEYDFRVTGATQQAGLNGIKSNQGIYEESSIVIPLTAVGKSSLVIKEIYFAGVQDFYFKDQFIEIYNNSDQVQYLDGILLGIVDEGLPQYSAAPSVWVDEAGNLLPRYPLYGFTMTFPGTGTEHPIQPGQSVIVAQNATNHAGRALSGEDVASTVDLSRAEWETYCKPHSPVDNDNTDVPNMDYMYHTMGIDFMIGTSGQSFILAKLPAGTTNADFVATESNFAQIPGKSTKFLMIPHEYVLDGVDIVRCPINERFKKLLSSEDVGYTYVDGSNDNSLADASYCGKSIRRKVKEIMNGRVVYQDTNNSSVDFITGGQTPTPKVFSSTVGQ